MLVVVVGAPALCRWRECPGLQASASMWGGLCCRCGVGACRRCPSSAIAFWVRRRAPSVLSRRGRRVRAVPCAPCGLVIDNVSSRRAAGAACRRSRLVLSRGRECCPRGVFAPCPLEFGGVRRAPCRGPARLSPRPPCCSPALSSLCTITEPKWLGDSPRGCCFSGRTNLLFLPPVFSREKDSWCAPMGGSPVRRAAWRFQIRGATPARGFIPHGPWGGSVSSFAAKSAARGRLWHPVHRCTPCSVGGPG